MSSAEQDRVVASLPYVVGTTVKRRGDAHARVVYDTVEALRNRGVAEEPGSRPMYVGRFLEVRYPDVPAFAPDAFVVLDAANDMRDTWEVGREGRGLDLAIDVLWRTESVSDCQGNVDLYASVGIPEYFVFDLNRMVITGHRLEPGTSVYRPILGQRGRFWSEVLGLHIAVQGEQFRFFSGVAMLPTTRELQRRLHEGMVAAIERAAAEAERAAAEAERAAAEAERAAAEAERADTAEARVRDLEAQLAALLASQTAN